MAESFGTYCVFTRYSKRAVPERRGRCRRGGGGTGGAGPVFTTKSQQSINSKYKKSDLLAQVGEEQKADFLGSRLLRLSIYKNDGCSLRNVSLILFY